ncbi:ATP-dependent endonuclease [candidate division CSSED10-310 bacterium]|uniref:ATP-dependent endonuclease n=1 Tax=candidate division CSSED10-310 bacterium TaxID=2855610 RepID=A0ABV6YXM5_UNCC1
MQETVRFTSIEFKNFKAFSNFSVRLSDMNILVGPNNCGKSTIINAFRALWSGIRRARSRSAKPIARLGGFRFGYILSEETIPISLENVHTEYEDTDTNVIFRLSNKNKLRLFLPNDGGVILIPEVEKGRIRSPSNFKAEFPVTITVVPVLGPLEHEEEFVKKETVLRELSTHRASRHFRNYWYYFREEFDEFSLLVKNTWPGMEIQKPDPPDLLNKTISMFCLENRITRELFWSGFGFQIWCQLITHISRAKNSNIIVIDEPEIYLHPDAQRQLIEILRFSNPDVLIATHSSEIISEADPSEILLVDKSKRSAKRLSDLEEVQRALELVGSIQNITLTHLARNRKVVFVEDEKDFILIRRYAKILGYNELGACTGITPVKSEGFGSWDRIRSVGWGIERTFGKPINISVIYDRDYYCDKEIEEITDKLKEHIQLVHVHKRKEIENYLLEPQIVERALLRAIKDRENRTGEMINEEIFVNDLLEEASSDLKSKTISQYAAKKSQYLHKEGIDAATVIEATTNTIEDLWDNISARMKCVSGKEVLKKLRKIVKYKYKVNLSDFKLVDAYNRDLIPEDIKNLVKKLEAFRKN